MRRATSIRSSPSLFVAVIAKFFFFQIFFGGPQRVTIIEVVRVADRRCHFQTSSQPRCLVVKEGESRRRSLTTFTDCCRIASRLAYRIRRCAAGFFDALIDGRVAIGPQFDAPMPLLRIDWSRARDERIASLASALHHAIMLNRKLVLVSAARVACPRHHLDPSSSRDAASRLRNGLRRFGFRALADNGSFGTLSGQMGAVRNPAFDKQFSSLGRIVGMSLTSGYNQVFAGIHWLANVCRALQDAVGDGGRLIASDNARRNAHVEKRILGKGLAGVSVI